MSLLERVQSTASYEEVSDTTRNWTLDLRDAVQEIVSMDRIALLMGSNPEMARNEIRSACRQVFRDEAWLAVGQSQREQLTNDVINTVFGFGLLEGLLADESITEIMVNGTRSLYYERNGRLYASEQRFSDEDQLRALVDRILGPLGRRIDEALPTVNARLPQGHRVNVVIEPLSLIGPVITIRKFTEHVMTLQEMIELGSFDGTVARFLTWSVLLRKNIAVSGGTGSGKTTLLNALSCVIPDTERIVTIEDSAELRFFEHPHVIPLEARPRNAEGTGEVTIRDLVINALRMRPDRIVVGECRGAEALDMLQAMQTGHDGSLTTLHANSPAEVVSRLTTMVRYQADLPVDVIEASVGSALDLVVQTARSHTGARYVSHIVELSYSDKQHACVIDPLYYRGPLDDEGSWVNYPSWVETLPDYGYARHEEVLEWVQQISSAL